MEKINIFEKLTIKNKSQSVVLKTKLGDVESKSYIPYTAKAILVNSIQNSIYNIEYDDNGKIIGYSIGTMNPVGVNAYILAVLSQEYLGDSIDFEQFEDMGTLEIVDKLDDIGVIQELFEKNKSFTELYFECENAIEKFKEFIDQDTKNGILDKMDILIMNMMELSTKMQEKLDLEILEVQKQIDYLPSGDEELLSRIDLIAESLNKKQ